jgi:hypothetical protein
MSPITKPEEHEINRAGKRLLRDVLEPLKWVVNDVQEDYGIDTNVQVFDGKSPTGAWFHVQLKSSASSDYAADGSFVSQELSIDHARHYALEMREPVLLIHADVTAKAIYWYAPQLDGRLVAVLGKTGAKFITMRVPTRLQLPQTAPGLLTSLDQIYLVLAGRELTSATNQTFAESIKHLPDQETLHRAFQEKNDTLKLQKIAQFFKERKLDEAQPRAEAILSDPDSTVEVKFWAQLQLEGIEFTQTVHTGRPQSELPMVAVKHAEALRRLAASGPNYLKFYALIARSAAELDVLVQENLSLFMGLHQHLEEHGNPMMALGLYARKTALTKRIVSKYNQCLRLARSASNYPDRWMLGRAMTRIVHAIGKYIVTAGSEKNLEAQNAFAQSALQVCKVAAWICEETGDGEGVILVILSALMTTHSTDSDAYRWASSVADRVSDPEIKTDAFNVIDRAVKRWKGEAQDGDYQGNTIWQVIQNIASGLGIDLSDENDPLVRGLRIAAKDNSSERVLATCEHILGSLGATGPIARRITRLFNISTAGCKVIHCTLHNYHVEGKELDSAYAEFKRRHCDSCPDRRPRPEEWRGTGEEIREIQFLHRGFVASLAGTPNGFRFTKED